MATNTTFPTPGHEAIAGKTAVSTLIDKIADMKVGIDQSIEDATDAIPTKDIEDAFELEVAGELILDVEVTTTAPNQVFDLPITGTTISPAGMVDWGDGTKEYNVASL